MSGPKRSHLKDLFLSTYQEQGTIQAAAKKIGIERNTVYHWLEDDDFMEKFRHADENLKEVYENAAQYRGVKGVKRFVLYNGKPVLDPTDPEKKRFLMTTEYSDHCLEMLLAAKDPEHYGRRRADLQIKIDVQLIQQISSEMLAVIRRIIPSACPHCKTVLDVTPKLAKEFELLSSKFDLNQPATT